MNETTALTVGWAQSVPGVGRRHVHGAVLGVACVVRTVGSH